MDLRIVPGTLAPPTAVLDPFARIQARLLAYPQVRWDASPTYLVVHPVEPEGFEVALLRRGRTWVVCCDDWRTTFSAPEDALALFWLALSPSARLRVWERGRTRYRWQMETLAEGSWRRLRHVSLPVFPFWRRARVLELQNHLLQAA